MGVNETTVILDKKDLQKFIDTALKQRDNANKRVKIGSVSADAQIRIEKVCGTKPRWINIDNNGIVHAIKQKHHNLQKDDIQLVAEAINTSSDITQSQKKHLNNDVLVFKTDIDGEITFLAELHAKNGYLMIFNAWRKENARSRRSSDADKMPPKANALSDSPHTDTPLSTSTSEKSSGIDSGIGSDN
ncbi:MAG: hypothetical protein Ta2F_16630 [Termitinemataceae bacterium]|nr:MAG: hypothetical protein Ta2F_16630 [Termitinemataceae bacterium]